MTTDQDPRARLDEIKARADKLRRGLLSAPETAAGLPAFAVLENDLPDMAASLIAVLDLCAKAEDEMETYGDYFNSGYVGACKEIVSAITAHLTHPERR